MSNQPQYQPTSVSPLPPRLDKQKLFKKLVFTNKMDCKLKIIICKHFHNFSSFCELVKITSLFKSSFPKDKLSDFLVFPNFFCENNILFHIRNNFTFLLLLSFLIKTQNFRENVLQGDLLVILNFYQTIFVHGPNTQCLKVQS